MNTDVLIIGGGVIGLSIARELHKKGARKIALVEKGRCGQESSWAAAGMLGPQTEADEMGPFFDLCCASRDLYPEFAAELLDETGVDIQLDRTGTLFLAYTDDDIEHIRSRYDWQKNAGLPVELLSAEETRKMEPVVSPDVRGALYFPHDWQVENRKLLAALRRYAELAGIAIIENARVERLTVEDGKVVGAATNNGRINAGDTILATGAWTSLIKIGTTPVPVNVEPIRGQMIAFRTAERLFRHVIYSGDGYVVPRLDGRILAGSTTEKAGFDASTTAAASNALKEMAGEIIPEIKDLAIADRWAGLRPFAPDGLPVLGRIGSVDGLFVATAHYRNGILLAPITAKLAAASLLDRVESEYCATFGPDRFRTARVGVGN